MLYVYVLDLMLYIFEEYFWFVSIVGYFVVYVIKIIIVISCIIIFLMSFNYFVSEFFNGVYVYDFIVGCNIILLYCIWLFLSVKKRIVNFGLCKKFYMCIFRNNFIY